MNQAQNRGYEIIYLKLTHLQLSRDVAFLGGKNNILLTLSEYFCSYETTQSKKIRKKFCVCYFGFMIRVRKRNFDLTLLILEMMTCFYRIINRKILLRRLKHFELLEMFPVDNHLFLSGNNLSRKIATSKFWFNCCCQCNPFWLKSSTNYLPTISH